MTIVCRAFVYLEAAMTSIETQDAGIKIYIYIWDKSLVITVPVDVLAPSGASPSADKVLSFLGQWTARST